VSRPVLIDADVMIDYLRGVPAAGAFVNSLGDRAVLSSLTVAELCAGVKGEQELAFLDEVTSRFPILPLTTEIGRAGGLLRRDYGKSHGVGLNDALAAATAMSEGADLATLNVKHFPMFKGLKAPYTKR
jgi:predicted nucleic acid-binding protein